MSLSSELPMVSVIVPVRNAEQYLGDQLSALASQSTDFGWEVVLVDNGSTDSSVAVAEEFRSLLPALTIVTETSKFGPGPARNSGVREARGEYLLFCDADDLVGAGWLTAMKLALDGAPLVCGEIELDRLNTKQIKTMRPSQRTTDFGGQKGFLPAAGTNNLGVQRWLFEAVDGFDESYGALSDVDFSYRAQLYGAELVMTRDSVVHYRFRHDLGSIFRQGRRFGAAGVKLRQRFVPLGMPRRTWKSTASRLLRLILTLPSLTRAERRPYWIHQAGRLIGLFVGWMRYVVISRFSVTGTESPTRSGPETRGDSTSL